MSDRSCERCGGTGYVVVERNGLSGAERCACVAETIKERRIPRASIPEKFSRASFESFNLGRYESNPPLYRALGDKFREIRGYAREYQPTWRKPGLLIVGSHGIGKTHLAISVLRELLGKGYDGVYFDYQTLLDRIQAGWNREAGVAEKEAYQTALDTPILLLDDIGARRSIDWVEDTVTAIITHRCNENKTLIATSNLPMEQTWSGRTTPGGSPRYGKTMAEVIGQRAASRLYEMCRIVEMPELPDYRPSITN